ncbi:MAG: hypothetical protein ACTSV5_05145 [Promethearchaeota archaeon]
MSKLPEITEKIEKLKKELLIEEFEEVNFSKKQKMIFEACGWTIFISCVYYWIFFFFFVHYYEPLLYTTYFTSILIGITFIYRFESLLFNSITCITFYGFINITIGLIFTTTDILSFITGPILHAFIAAVQLFIIFHKKIPINEGYLLWGLLFYFIFMGSYDSFQRWNFITGLATLVSDVFTKAYAFYALWLSGLFVHFYKKKQGLLRGIK